MAEGVRFWSMIDQSNRFCLLSKKPTVIADVTAIFWNLFAAASRSARWVVSDAAWLLGIESYRNWSCSKLGVDFN